MTQKTLHIVGIILGVFLFTHANIFAQFNEEEVKSKLPDMIGSSNEGTEFALTFHPCWEEQGANNAIRIYVSSGVATRVTLRIPTRGHEETKVTIPNDIIAFHLLPEVAQPYSKTDRFAPLPHQVFRGYGILLDSDDPVIVYGVTRYRYTSDGYLAIPTNGLGKEYVVASFGDPVNTPEPQRFQWLSPYTSIVGVYDNTRVDFRVGGPTTLWVPENTTAPEDGIRPGRTMTEYIDKGDVWLIPGMGPTADLTGSYVRATKPVAVISGSFCAYIPSHMAACDFIIEQDLPMNTWGNHYHVTPIAERKRNSYVSIMARENNTTINRNGIPWTSIKKGKGGSQEEGGYFQGRISNVDAPLAGFTLSSSPDEPFTVTQYNTGMQDDNVPTDPFQMVLTPLEQYQTEIIFNTPGINDEYGFAKNWLNILYLSSEDGAIPDDLEFGRVVNGQVSWTKLINIDGHPGYPMWTAERPDGRKYFAKQLQLIWGDGVYKLRANEPFAAYAYGGSDWDSYGFPTSVALANLEIPDTHPPVIYYTMDCDGNVPAFDIPNARAFVKDSARYHLGETESKLGLIYMVRNSSFNYHFEVDEFVAGETLQTNFRLTVLDKRQPAQARLVFTDRRGNNLDTTITYNPTRFAIRPTFHDFGLQKLGDAPVTMNYTVQNLSDKYEAHMGKFFFKSSYQDYDVKDYNPNDADSESAFEFDLSGLNFGVPFAPLETREFTVTFNPVSEGIFIDSIGVGDGQDCLYFYQSEVRASVGNPQIYVTDYDFGAVIVGTQTQWRTITVTNNGNTALQITGYEGPELTVYETQNIPSMSETQPWVIPVNGSSTFQVRFSPDAVENYPDEIRFISDADQTHSNYKPYATINGRGIEPGLLVNSYNWERRRSDIPRYATRPDINVDPYPNTDDVITLSNEGSAPVTIYNVTIVENVKGEAFILENGQTLLQYLATFSNVTIEPGENRKIQVEFHPTTSGEHRLVLAYESDAPDNVQTVLQGIGTYPEVVTEDIAFDEFTVGSNPMSDNVEFINTEVQISAPQYLDVLTITDIEIVNGPASFNEADINNSTQGSPVFWINKEDLFPIQLNPDDALSTLTIPVVFHPGYNGTFTAQIRTVSDAYAEATATITGSSIVEAPIVTGDEATVCVGESIVLTGQFRNEGTAPSIINDMYMSDDLFVIDNNLIAQLPITVQPGGVVNIPVTFTPDAADLDINARLTIETASNLPQYQFLHANYIGISTIYPRTSIATVTRESVAPDQTFDYSLMINKGDDEMSLANVTQLAVTLEYNREFIAALLPDNNPASGITVHIPNWKVDNVQKSFTENELTVIILSGPAITTREDIPVFTLKFKGFLPSDLAGNRMDVRLGRTEINHSITTYKGSDEEICVPITPLAPPVVEYVEVCADNLRILTLSQTEFALQEINPNPVNGNGADIHFSIGIPLYAELNIYNAAGDLVMQPVSGHLQTGEYTANISTQELSSGIYFYELNAGHFRETKKMVVQK